MDGGYQLDFRQLKQQKLAHIIANLRERQSGINSFIANSGGNAPHVQAMQLEEQVGGRWIQGDDAFPIDPAAWAELAIASLIISWSAGRAARKEGQRRPEYQRHFVELASDGL
jgi:hypothetical protein